MTHAVHNLEQLLDRIGEAAQDKDEVSFDSILNTIGRRSFGPILLLAGLVTVSPLGGIPGFIMVMAALVFAVAIQLLFQRDHFWLPDWLLRRAVGREKLETTLRWSRRPAQFIDRLLKVRLEFLTHKAGTTLIAVLCVVIALGMPPMELVPFSGAIAGIALLLFGLAMIAHDGLVALFGMLFFVGAYGFLLYKFL